MSIMNLLICQKSDYDCWMAYINVIKEVGLVILEFGRHKICYDNKQILHNDNKIITYNCHIGFIKKHTRSKHVLESTGTHFWHKISFMFLCASHF